MTDYTKIFLYLIELDNICEEKNWNDINTNKALRIWLLSILKFYNPLVNIIDHLDLEEYLKYNFEKLKQTQDIKVLEYEEIMHNPNCLLYKCIEKTPYNANGIETRLSKREEYFTPDENGEYYLSASGICHNGETIELANNKDFDHILQHELQHINQNYAYPSEFPFAEDMLTMLNEGEAEYHYHLLDMLPYYASIEQNDSYYIYYLVYTLLMLVLPKQMRDSWNKMEKFHCNTYTFPNIFKYISDSDINISDFSHIFALATIIVALCNSENTKEIFDTSVNTSLNRCLKKIESYNDIIHYELDLNRKHNVEVQKQNIEFLKENINILQNPDLLQKANLEAFNEEKEFIASESKEKQKELLRELQQFTLEKFKSILMEKVEELKEAFQKCQTKKEQTPQEILGEEDYRRYQYYKFGLELNTNMQWLLRQQLTFSEIFEQLLEKVTSHLVESKDTRLEEKVAFIDKIRKNCLANEKNFKV